MPGALVLAVAAAGLVGQSVDSSHLAGGELAARVLGEDGARVVEALLVQPAVRRTPDPSDRRRNTITITAAGRRQLRRLDGVLAGIQDDLLEPLSVAERTQLTRLLTRVLDHHAAK